MMTTSNFFETVEELYKDWHYDSPRVLYSLIRMLRPKWVLETGAYRGYSASYMSRALQENGSGHMFCIDNFSLTDHEARLGVKAREHLDSNLKSLGVRELITIIDGDSDKVEWPEHIDFAYIDGWHSYKAALHDFQKCAERGASCICLDDTIQSVGPRMVRQHIELMEDWECITLPCTCGMTIAMRKVPFGPITFSQELPNNPGVDLNTLTKDEQLNHLVDAAVANQLSYASILPFLCEGRPA